VSTRLVPTIAGHCRPGVPASWTGTLLLLLLSGCRMRLGCRFSQQRRTGEQRLF